MSANRLIRRAHRRRGIVLLVVLLVVVALALTAYTYCELMLVERQAVEFHGRRLQTRMLAESGIGSVMSALSSRRSATEPAVNIHDDPVRFRTPVGPEEVGGKFTVFSSTADGEVRYGVLDLSSRLNLNVIALIDDESLARQSLLAIPGMSEAVADAILDWIDADDEPRLFGAESNYYASQDPAYACRNRPLGSLDELLLVRGVTPALLYGADRNRNGLIDASEQQDDGTTGGHDEYSDNPVGWRSWLTVLSGEGTLRRDGRPRINLNHGELTELFDELESELGETAAKFVVAYRMYGPHPARDDVQRSSPSRGRSTSAQPIDGVVPTKERAGLSLNAGPRYSIRSVFDLVETQIGYVDESGGLITSQWSRETGGVGQPLRELEQAVTITSAPFIPGRLNLLEANAAVLAGFPGISEDVAQRIVALRSAGALGSDEKEESLGWLLSDGILDLDTLRNVAPLLTTGGDIFSAQVIGHFADRVVPCCRLEFTVDASGLAPRLIRYRDVSTFGPGWPTDQREQSLHQETVQFAGNSSR